MQNNGSKPDHRYSGFHHNGYATEAEARGVMDAARRTSCGNYSQEIVKENGRYYVNEYWHGSKKK